MGEASYILHPQVSCKPASTLVAKSFDRLTDCEDRSGSWFWEVSFLRSGSVFGIAFVELLVVMGACEYIHRYGNCRV